MLNRLGAAMGVIALACGMFGCHEPVAASLGVAAGVTTIGGYSPTHELEQVYYLGVFDPEEQVPPAVYRIRVRGQSSLISNTSYASGWVPAGLVDSLGTRFTANPNTGGVKITRGDTEAETAIKSYRRQMLFGPEGFREAPRDHRLVIVMGASPENYFKAVNMALGKVAQNETAQPGKELKAAAGETLTALEPERAVIEQVRLDIASTGGAK